MALFGRKDPAAIPLKNEPYSTLALVLEDGDFSRWLDAMGAAFRLAGRSLQLRP